MIDNGDLPYGEIVEAKLEAGPIIKGYFHRPPQRVAAGTWFVAESGEHVSLSAIKGWREIELPRKKPEEEEPDLDDPKVRVTLADLTAAEIKKAGLNNDN